MSGEDDELERLAVEELLNEAKRAKERSQTMGTYGWQKRKATTNKRFLHNTLVSTLREYKMHSSYSHVSQRRDSKWSKSDKDGGNFKSARSDAIFDESNYNSKSRKDSGAEDKEPSKEDVLRIADDENDISKSGNDKIKELHQTEDVSTEKDISPDYHQYVRKEKHGKQSRSRSPLRKESNSDHRDDHDRDHHRYRERRKIAKIKENSKHKDRHSRSDNRNSSKRGDRNPPL